MNDGEIFTLWQRSLEFMERQVPGSVPGSPIQVLVFARAVEERAREECAAILDEEAGKSSELANRLEAGGHSKATDGALARVSLCRNMAAAIRAGGGEGRREEQ
jgi:hypothetical protein